MKSLSSRIGLHRKKTNSRWTWMAGATAASAAAATSAQANSEVTMTLTNNYLDYLQGNHLSADIFGNGNIFSFSFVKAVGNASIIGSAVLHIHTFKMLNGGGAVSAFFHGPTATARAYSKNGLLLTSQRSTGQRVTHMHTHPHPSNSSSTFTFTYTYQPGKAKVKFSLPIAFMDPSVNGNALTQGLLEGTADAMGVASEGEAGVAHITLESFTYTMIMPNGVPEGGSTLALLAMGAGGVIAFRHRKKTA